MTFLAKLVEISWEMLHVTGHAGVWTTTSDRTEDYRPVVDLARRIHEIVTPGMARSLLESDAPRLGYAPGNELTDQWGMFTRLPRIGLARYLVEISGETFVTSRGRVLSPGAENALLALDALSDAVRVDPAKCQWIFYGRLFLTEISDRFGGSDLLINLARRDLEDGYNDDFGASHTSPDSMIEAWRGLGDVVRGSGLKPIWERIIDGEAFPPIIRSWTQFV